MKRVVKWKGWSLDLHCSKSQGEGTYLLEIKLVLVFHFLPTLGSIKSFCSTYGLPVPTYTTLLFYVTVPVTAVTLLHVYGISRCIALVNATKEEKMQVAVPSSCSLVSLFQFSVSSGWWLLYQAVATSLFPNFECACPFYAPLTVTSKLIWRRAIIIHTHKKNDKANKG